MHVNKKNLIDDAQCYETVRELRLPEERRCAFCDSKSGIRRGFDDKETARQHYEYKECGKCFGDLTGTLFSGHHQPLRVWILGLCFMGLNLSNSQIAKETDLDRSDVRQLL